MCQQKGLYVSLNFSQYINILQEPQQIPLGTHMKWKGCGPKRKHVLKRDEMIYVPLIQTLQQILQSNVVRDQVNKYVNMH